MDKRTRKKLESLEVNRRDTKIPCFLGNLKTHELEVEGKPSMVYVTVAFIGVVLTVKNSKVPNRFKTPVWVGYEKGSHRRQVLSEREVHNNNYVAEVGHHDHTWGMSDNPAWIRKEQILFGLPAASGLTIVMGGTHYKIGNQFHVINNTVFDMESHIPVSGSIWVNVEIDADGVITYVESDPVDNRWLLTPELIPETPNNRWLLFSVKMYEGQEIIIQSYTDTDIFDPRFMNGGLYELPVPTETTLGGVKRNEGTAGQYVNGIDEEGNLTYDTPEGGGAVESVSGDGVNNSDPANPVISYPALSDLDVEGATEIGTGLVDIDQFVVGKASNGNTYRSNISRIWTYIKSKVTGAVSGLLETNLTASRALVSNGSGKIAVSTVSDTELGYLSGVTSAIQTQINNLSNVYIPKNGWNTITSTLTPISQAYTNDPAAGELITLNMTDTSKFFVYGGVIVSSSAGAEMAIVMSMVANTSITVSKLALNHTTTNPVVIAFAVDTSADETANIQKGDKVKIDQSSDKFFVVNSVTSSRITFIPTSTNLLTTASITAGYYSHIENPTGWIGSLSFVPRFFRGTTDFTNDPTVNSMKYSVIGDKLSGTIDFTMPASAGGSGPIYCAVPAIVLVNSVMIGLEFTTGAAITITASSSGNVLTFYTINPVAVIPDTSGYKYVGSFEYLF